MATVFGNLSGYTFSSLSTTTGGEAIPAGQLWIAFSTTNAVGMTLVGATDSFGKALYMGSFAGAGFFPAISSVILIFTPIPTINAL